MIKVFIAGVLTLVVSLAPIGHKHHHGHGHHKAALACATCE